MKNKKKIDVEGNNYQQDDIYGNYNNIINNNSNNQNFNNMNNNSNNQNYNNMNNNSNNGNYNNQNYNNMNDNLNNGNYNNQNYNNMNNNLNNGNYNNQNYNNMNNNSNNGNYNNQNYANMNNDSNNGNYNNMNNNDNNSGYVYQEKEYKTNTLDENTTVTKASAISRFLLIGFYLLVLVVGVAAFFMIRANKYEFYLKKESVLLTRGSTYQVELTPKNEKNFDYLNYNYSIADERIATVDEYGTVTAKGTGTTTLKISLKPGIMGSKTMRIVSQEVEVESVKLAVDQEGKYVTGEYFNLAVDQSATLKAIINDDDSLNVSATYSSSNTDVAVVDSFGNVTGKQSGTAVITGVVNEVEGTITVNVTNNKTPHIITPTDEPIDEPTETPSSSSNSKVTKVSLGVGSTINKRVGDVLQLKAAVEPRSVTNYTVKWTSSKPKVATVDSKGKVKFLAAGTVVITAEVNGVKGKVTIVVKAKSSGSSTSKPATTSTSSTTSQTPPPGSKFTGEAGKYLGLNKTTLTIKKGSEASFVLSLKEATGTIFIDPKDTSIISVTYPESICNDKEKPPVCFIDAFTSEQKVTFKVKGLKAGKTTIEIRTNEVMLAKEGDPEISGSAKIGILVK